MVTLEEKEDLKFANEILHVDLPRELPVLKKSSTLYHVVSDKSTNLVQEGGGVNPLLE